MLFKTGTALALASLASAHFNLFWPYSAGFVEDDEPTSPCGGATVIVNSSSPQIQVDRFAAWLRVGHPTGSFTLSATTDTSAPYNFTQIAVLNASYTGPFSFCADYLSAPSSFAGKAGVIQVIDASPDGTLYQCAPVNFVSGSNSTLGDYCKNTTGITLTGTSSSGNSAGSNSGSMSTTLSGTATPATTSSSSSRTNAAALATFAVAPIVGGLGAIAAGLMI